MDNNIPFPQANNFEKIIAILSLPNEQVLNSVEKLGAIIGDMSERQVSYYMSAAMFLGLIKTDGTMKQFTSIAHNIRSKNTCEQIAELISLLLLNPIFNKAYVNTLLFGKQEIDDIIAIIKEYYPTYSDSIFKRRAQTVSSWINWIFSQIEAGK